MVNEGMDGCWAGYDTVQCSTVDQKLARKTETVPAAPEEEISHVMRVRRFPGKQTASFIVVVG